MNEQVKNPVGLFHVKYDIVNSIAGKPLLGAPQLTLDILVDTVNKSVVGGSTVYQATPNFEPIISQISGEWSYMCTMDSCNILVVADGVAPSTIIVGGHPEMHKNLKLRMSLSEDWQTGYANFSYLQDGTWQEVEYAVVKNLNVNLEQNIKELSEVTTKNQPKAA
jgi:hypothetical protein